MFSRKLKALEHPNPESFALNDEAGVRNLVIWLEDQKIRFYKIEDRVALREINNPGWVTALKKYLSDLGCPVKNLSQKAAVVNWMLSYAIRLDYADNASDLNKKHSERDARKHAADVDMHGGMSDITGDDPDLKAGVMSLAKLLGMPDHPDHTVVLQAVSRFVETRLSDEAIAISRSEAAKKKPKLKEIDFMPLNKTSLGFDVNDSAINEAAKIIRLLQIHELRELQTRINQAIVSVQRVTANPKTDQSLGRVGR